MQFEIRTEECMVLEIDGHRSVMTREQVGSLYRHLSNWLGADSDIPVDTFDESDRMTDEQMESFRRFREAIDRYGEQEKVLRGVNDHFERQRRTGELRKLQEEIEYYRQKTQKKKFPCPRPEQLKPIVTCGKE